MRVGESLQVVAFPRDENGNSVPGLTVVWESSDTAVAAVSASGLVEAKGLGAAEITASTSGQVAKATLVVRFGSVQFAAIPAGSFAMGSDGGDLGLGPVHGVDITHDFYLQKMEVTQREWAAVMDSAPSYFKLCGATCPVERVSWDDVQVFLAVVSSEDPDATYRLPTEAEWEYAARAGTTNPYSPVGPVMDIGWFAENSGGTPHPVGRKAPNAWGVWDMHGNVAEWVQDYYSETYYAESPRTDPTGPTSALRRAIRGGSFFNVASGASSFFRMADTPTGRFRNVGFRLVRVPRALTNAGVS